MSTESRSAAPVDAARLERVPAVPGAPKPDSILVADDVRKHFGGLRAVDVDHLEVQRGVITALIGPNGAGKTTLFNVLTGFEDPDRGRWSFDGMPLGGRVAHRIAQSGMVRTFQLTKALRKMTVLDNMKLAAPEQRGERFLGSFLHWTWASQERAIEQKSLELLERFDLAHMRDEYAGTLSGGQRKLLEIARALMADPSLLLLDEPMAGVNPALVESLLHHIRALPSAGTTVLFIEHDMDVVMGVSHWVVCMAQGSVIAEGPPHAIRNDETVIDAYLGARPDAAGPPSQPTP